jgi:flagellar biosynthesis protein
MFMIYVHGEARLRRTDDLTQSNLKPSPSTESAISVALSEQEGGRAPKVIAAGRGTVAEQILALAFAHGIKVREDADLAELLSAIDIDSEIPVEAFTAVAEILRYVYLANAETDSKDAPSAADWVRGKNR